ncbi:MAG: hypothetical protein PF495_13690 [Spirochaetales bacterium]|jgi:hypothetical protein|nr:hypothetical protein [Spirochaetales bacterium]
MTFSPGNPPVWFRVLVYIGLAAAAAGLVVIVTRNSILRQHQVLEQREKLLRSAVEEKIRLSYMSALEFELSSDTTVREAAVKVIGSIEGFQAEDMKISVLSDYYCRTDQLLNDLILLAFKRTGIGKAERTAAEYIMNLPVQDEKTAAAADKYNAAADRYNRLCKSFLYAAAAAIAAAEQKERFSCTRAFLNEY